MSDVTKVCRDTSELNELVKVMLDLALTVIKEKKVNPLIVETYRSQERQNYLYCQGRTVDQATAAGISKTFAKTYCNPDANQVTWTLNSVHKSRKAIDIVPQRKVNGVMTAIWDNNDSETKTIIKYMKEYGFEAGVDWSTPDGPHFQVKGDFTTYFNVDHNTTFVTKVIQKALNKKCESGLVIDGDWGPKTTKAVNTFRKKMGYTSINGKLGTTALKALLS